MYHLMGRVIVLAFDCVCQDVMGCKTNGEGVVPSVSCVAWVRGWDSGVGVSEQHEGLWMKVAQVAIIRHTTMTLR